MEYKRANTMGDGDKQLGTLPNDMLAGSCLHLSHVNSPEGFIIYETSGRRVNQTQSLWKQTKINFAFKITK